MFKYEIEYLNEFNIWVPLENWVRPIMNKSTLDETHDETQIFLSCSPIKEPFKPFTKFIINIKEVDENDNIIDVDTLYRVVIADEITQVVFEDVEDKDGNISDGLYDHDIRLAEATKELERYTVDNLSFTNEWNKAFQTIEGGASLINYELKTDWYNKNAIVNSGNNQFYYVNMFTDYNSDNAGYNTNVPGDITQPIEQTYIAKTLSINTTDKNYSFSNSVLSSVIIGNQIVIPRLTLTDIAQKHIYYGTDAFLYKWDAYIQFRTVIEKIELIDPYGKITNVTAESLQTLNKLGRYRLRYTAKRQVRTRTLYRNRLTENVLRDEYYGWYDGNVIQLQFEIFCVESGSQIDKLSIFDILNKLVQVTPTRYNQQNTTLFSLYNDGTDKSIFNRYASVEAPEMIFTNKNLWEALREIGGIINAIPYLNIQNKNNWNVIDFLPLSSEEKVSDKVEEEYCNSTSYYDSENYTASYDLSIDNMINPVSTKEGYINEAGYQISKSIRSEEAEISETSMEIETVYPIYKIDKVEFVNYELNIPKIDITNNVVEKSIYNTLVSSSENAGKAINIYYTQGQKNIKGLQFKVSKNEYNAAKNLIAIKEIIKSLSGGTIEMTSEQVLNSKFIIKYVPFLNARIKIYKTNAPKLNIQTSMFQNQSANVIDARALGRKLVANIGRVGNLGYVDSIKSYSLDKIPLKGQRSKDNYFVATVTTEYDQNHLLSSVQYTKDYQKISDFINIQNLQRYYEVSEKQSIHRYINSNMFYIFGNSVAEVDKENGLNQADGYPQINYLASLLVDQGYNRKINASILTAYSEENMQEYVCSKIYLNSNALAIGNTISIITDYLDNYGAGYQAVEYNNQGGTIITQGLMNRSVPYSDGKGKIKHLKIQNITDSNISYPSGNTQLENNINVLAKSLPAITNLVMVENDLRPGNENYLKIADGYENDNMPTFSNIGCLQDINIQKDSREVIHINQQHHFLTNDDNVVVGNAMTESCRFIQEFTNENPLKCRLVFLNNKIDNYEFKINEKDIIEIETNEQGILDNTINKIYNLCQEISNNNILNILSTTNNTDLLYLQPNLSVDGLIAGLKEKAEAWAIINNNNDLIIGRNQVIENNDVALPIYMSITSTY